MLQFGRIRFTVCMRNAEKNADRPTSIRERVKPSTSHISFVYNMCIHYLRELFTYTQRSSIWMHIYVCTCVTLDASHQHFQHWTSNSHMSTHIHLDYWHIKKKERKEKKRIKAATTRRPHHYTILPANPFNNCACKMYASFHRFSFIPSPDSFYTKSFLCSLLLFLCWSESSHPLT